MIAGCGCPLVGGENLPEGARLSLVAHTAGSVANYVDGTTFARGVRVLMAKDIVAQSVEEGTVAYMLASLMRIPFWAGAVQKGRWQPFEDVGTRGLLDKTVGLTGFGAIACHLVRMLSVFRYRNNLCLPHIRKRNQFGGLHFLRSTIRLNDNITGRRVVGKHLSAIPVGRQYFAFLPDRNNTVKFTFVRGDCGTDGDHFSTGPR